MVLVYNRYLDDMGSYSATPLYKKLGIKTGYKIYVKNSPSAYQEYFEQLPANLVFLNRRTKEIDFIHWFVSKKSEFEKNYKPLYRSLKLDGLLWISWPKGGSDIVSDLNRDYIRAYVLDNGLVDVKVCSINDDWSGLKFVYRLKDRKK